MTDIANLRENWRDEDGSAMYASPLRTAAALYIVALESRLTAAEAALTEEKKLTVELECAWESSNRDAYGEWCHERQPESEVTP